MIWHLFGVFIFLIITFFCAIIFTCDIIITNWTNELCTVRNPHKTVFWLSIWNQVISFVPHLKRYVQKTSTSIYTLFSFIIFKFACNFEKKYLYLKKMFCLINFDWNLDDVTFFYLSKISGGYEWLDIS